MGAVVRDVRFERVPGSTAGCAPYGCDRVTVDLGSIPAYSLTTTSTGRLRLELRGTGLPDPLTRTVDVTAYHGALRSITASKDAEAKTASIEIERTTEVPGSLSVEGGTLVWSFPVPRLNLAVAPVALTASRTVSNTGWPRWRSPPLPGVTPPTSFVP